MSKVTVIPINHSTLPPEMKQQIKAAKAKEGDTLRFLLTDEGTFAAILGSVIVAAVYSVLQSQSRISRQKEGADVLDSIFDGAKTKDELELEIAKEYGVNIEFEIAKGQKSSLLDKAFGIWQDHDITIDQIRERAWPKRV